ncbi:hypothetical protein FACS1894170_02900 [Planctomycetales bacterium]|nr:hypothetical protein FACS1894170_02900 [Planctomycetales bacterium]
MDNQQLFQEDFKRLAAVARRLCGAEAEDAVSDAYVKLLCEDPSPENPSAWLRRVVKNGAIDRNRRAKKTVSRPSNDFEYLPEEDDGGDTEREVEVSEMLGGVPEGLRVILVMRFFEDKSLQEIADLTGSSRSSVQRDCEKALELLRKSALVSLD